MIRAETKMFILKEFFFMFLSAPCLAVSISVIHFTITYYNKLFRLNNILTLSEISVIQFKNAGSVFLFTLFLYFSNGHFGGAILFEKFADKNK
jgi:hypothetical protein